MGFLLLFVASDLIRPNLRSMQNTQDPDAIRQDNICRDIRGSRDNELPRSSDTHHAAAFGKFNQSSGCTFNRHIDMDGTALGFSASM